MVIGDYFQAPHLWTERTLIHRGSVGYDGQFYYYMAHDPFLRGPTYDHIDFPAYRYQRILYPLAVWIFSGGRAPLIPWMMVAVNVGAYLLGVAVVLGLLRRFGRSPWYGLLYAAFWGFLLCLLRCLPEPMAMTWVVLALFFHFQRRVWLKILFLILAALTQETTLLVSLAFFLDDLRQGKRLSALLTCLPPSVYLLWQAVLFSKFKIFSFLGGTQNFGLPFWGWSEKMLLLLRTGRGIEQAAEGLFLLMVLGLIGAALIGIIKKIDPLRISFLGYALMAVLFNQLIWVEPWSYARATLGLLTFNFLIFTKEGGKLNLYLLSPIPLIYGFFVLSMKLF